MHWDAWQYNTVYCFFTYSLLLFPLFLGNNCPNQLSTLSNPTTVYMEIREHAVMSAGCRDIFWFDGDQMSGDLRQTCGKHFAHFSSDSLRARIPLIIMQLIHCCIVSSLYNSIIIIIIIIVMSSSSTCDRDPILLFSNRRQRSITANLGHFVAHYIVSLVLFKRSIVSNIPPLMCFRPHRQHRYPV